MEVNVKVLIEENEVNAKIRAIAEKINEDYAGEDLHVVCILKGGVFFMCELVKHITVPVTHDFMSVSSYGDSKESSGIVRIAKDLDEPLEGRHVLVVEDIIDSGKTLDHLIPILRSRRPADIRLCTLLNKPDRREVDISVDYIGFDIPDYFVVGYGLDHAQKGRNLPYIAIAE